MEDTVKSSCLSEKLISKRELKRNNIPHTWRLKPDPVDNRSNLACTVLLQRCRLSSNADVLLSRYEGKIEENMVKGCQIFTLTNASGLLFGHQTLSTSLIGEPMVLLYATIETTKNKIALRKPRVANKHGQTDDGVIQHSVWPLRCK